MLLYSYYISTIKKFMKLRRLEVCIIKINMTSVLRKERARAGVKKRQAKATPAQIDYMIDYFVKYPHVAAGKFKSFHGNAELRGCWEQLVENLNKMAKDGKTKNMNYRR